MFMALKSFDFNFLDRIIIHRDIIEMKNNVRIMNTRYDERTNIDPSESVSSTIYI